MKNIKSALRIALIAIISSTTVILEILVAIKMRENRPAIMALIGSGTGFLILATGVNIFLNSLDSVYTSSC
ncbi:MAG: hypothetical protein FWF98_01495 [Dehalococcoidia bacterium]|nr:hypothetical protein [Dehalococcoidia bacterium]